MGRENFAKPEYQKFIFTLLEKYTAEEIHALKFYLAYKYEEYTKELPKGLLGKRNPEIFDLPPEELENILKDF